MLCIEDKITLPATRAVEPTKDFSNYHLLRPKTLGRQYQQQNNTAGISYTSATKGSLITNCPGVGITRSQQFDGRIAKLLKLITIVVNE